MQAKTALLQGRYEIVRPIAQGGMGAVYEGRDWESGGSAVALKLCVFNNEQMRDVFEREAHLLMRLSHPGLPKVRGLFNEGAGQYLVMDYVPGDNLETTLKDFGKPLNHRTVLQWADQLLDTLTYLHSLEPPVIHRDIKPANIKVTPAGRVMLLDFGFAKGPINNLSLYGKTSAYDPIELIRNSGTDPRSDLYALGATLFRLLTGRLPENVLARLESITATQHDSQPSVSDFVPTIPLIVAQAIHRALALNRDARFQSAQEMRELLQLALKVAPPPPPAYASSPYFAPPLAEGKVSNNTTPSELSSTHEDPPVHAHQATTGQQGASQPVTPAAPSFMPSPIFQGHQNDNDQPDTIPFPSASRFPSTMTIPLPAANLARIRARWPYAAAAFLAVLIFGGAMLGLLSQQFLGRSSAEPPILIASKAKAEKTTAVAWPAQFTNHIGVQFKLIPAGRYTMGAASEADAQPPHIVTLAQPFYMSIHEVTQLQFRALLRQNPSLHKGDALPVENVTWFEAQKYLAQLNLLNDGYRYRLPTEAEWEYAARAGQSEASISELERIAWFKYNAKTPQPVGQKEPNAFGLHDMLGNVAEWCADAYHESYAGAPTDGEAWMAATGSKLFRVIRGESWLSEADKVHAAHRNYDEPLKRNGMIGFRLVAEKVAEPRMP